MRRSFVILLLVSLMLPLLPQGVAQAEGEDRVVSLSAGSNHTLALKKDGTLWAWGANEAFQLGIEDLPQLQVARQVTGLPSIRAMAAGDGFSLAADNSGNVWGWGSNRHRVLNSGSMDRSADPIRLFTDSRVVELAAGEGHGIARLDNGMVYTWGDNLYGQLGVDNVNLSYSRNTVQVRELTDIVSIAAGPNHGAALDRKGRVWEWGYSASGYSPVPRMVSGELQAVEIQASWATDGAGDGGVTYFRSSKGEWLKAGKSGYQSVMASGTAMGLAQGAKSTSYIRPDGLVYMRNGGAAAVRVTKLQDAVQIEAGASFFSVLRKDGSVWTWKEQKPEAVRVEGFIAGLVFIDLKSHWSRPYVETLLGKRMVSGFEDGRYYPDQPVTREQFLKLLMSARPMLFEVNKPTSPRQTFTDVPKERWSNPYVEAAVRAGIVQPGDFDGQRFQPGKAISRMEMTIYLGRALGSTSNRGELQVEFADKKEMLAELTRLVRTPQEGRTLEQEHELIIHQLNHIFSLGVFSGYEDGTFRPKVILNRGQAAKIIAGIL